MTARQTPVPSSQPNCCIFPGTRAVVALLSLTRNPDKPQPNQNIKFTEELRGDSQDRLRTPLCTLCPLWFNPTRNQNSTSNRASQRQAAESMRSSGTPSIAMTRCGSQTNSVCCIHAVIEFMEFACGSASSHQCSPSRGERCSRVKPPGSAALVQHIVIWRSLRRRKRCDWPSCPKSGCCDRQTIRARLLTNATRHHEPYVRSSQSDPRDMSNELRSE